MGNYQAEAKRNSDKRIKWNWIEHKLLKEAEAIVTIAVDRNLEGYRRRGRPKRTWRRKIEDEI
jgi:hypothetical protein